MDFSPFVPYIVSIVLTLMYASVGKLSSGEPFDMEKFATTMGVQIATLIGFALITFVSNIDLSALVMALPTVITAIIMKLNSYFQKKNIVVESPPSVTSS